jgi:hypothetical protein
MYGCDERAPGIESTNTGTEGSVTKGRKAKTEGLEGAGKSGKPGKSKPGLIASA